MDKKQHIIESIVYGAMETGGFSLVVNADKLATYLLSLEERISEKEDAKHGAELLAQKLKEEVSDMNV